MFIRPRMRSSRLSRSTSYAVIAAGTAAVLALSACGGGDSTSAGSGSKTKDTLTVVTPDTGIVWSLDNGFGGLEALDAINVIAVPDLMAAY